MDVEKLRELRLASPFTPFVILLDDGRRFLIDEPYYMGISPTRKCVLVVPKDNKAVWFGPERVKDVVMLGTTPSEH